MYWVMAVCGQWKLIGEIANFKDHKVSWLSYMLLLYENIRLFLEWHSNNMLF